jgi:hypothetical protein
MTSPEIMANAMKEIQKALEDSKTKNGSTLGIDEISKTKSIIFWFNKCDSPEAAKKDTFIVWKIASLDQSGSADDRAVARKILAYVDILTVKQPDDDALIKTLKSIADSFEGKDWSFELSSPPYYDSSSKRYQLSYSAEKQLS